MGHLAERGHQLTPEPGDAEVLVVNTCSFIDPANRNPSTQILEMAQYRKRQRAEADRGGCMVTVCDQIRSTSRSGPLVVRMNWRRSWRCAKS